MKRKILISLVGIILMGGWSFLSPGKTSADVDVHIGIGIPLPVVVIPSPPAVVLIPNTPVYYAQDVGIDLFFYSGSWYRRYNDYWFRATYYNGPWVYMPPPQVPAVFVQQLPPGYYKIPPGHTRIPYGQLKKNWKKWDKEHRGHWKVHHEDDDD